LGGGLFGRNPLYSQGFIDFYPFYVEIQDSEYFLDLSGDGALLLLTALDKPVEIKMDRFLSTITSKTSNQNLSFIFNKITRPEKQVAEITRSVHIFFEGISKIGRTEKIDFVTVVFVMKNNLSVDARSYHPQSELPQKNLIEDKNSLAANAAREGKIIIIPDIEREARRGKASQISRHCTSEQGSALCFPISSGHIKGGVPLVLRITASKPFFNKKNRLVYIDLLEMFKKRILIEYALNELKNKTEVGEK